jgi:flagellar basal-body rod modification protein FlgD
MTDPVAATAVAGSFGTRTAAQSASPGKAPALTSDFDTFLKMLTAQARYQDPLEPIDSSEYAAQLAQFSMVEQQIRTNDSLADLSALMGLANMASMSGWVGMDVRAEVPAHFDGFPITVSPNPAAIADEAFLVVHDDTGAEVQRLPIPIAADPIQWAGVDDDGTPFPTGSYSFTVESHAEGKVIHSGPAEVYGRVVEAQLRSGETVLILPGGQAINSRFVTALRESAPAGT